MVSKPERRPEDDPRFQRVRDRVILLPNELPDIAGLSVLRAGVEFGEAKKNRIEPAHGIFMASRAENCRSVLHLTSNDPALFAFLRGEEIPAIDMDRPG